MIRTAIAAMLLGRTFGLMVRTNAVVISESCVSEAIIKASPRRFLLHPAATHLSFFLLKHVLHIRGVSWVCEQDSLLLAFNVCSLKIKVVDVWYAPSGMHCTIATE